MTQTTFDHYVIVELMGHQRIAGHATEEQICGTNLLRVDVPSVDGLPGFTKYFGPNAIYAITIVDEEAARVYAARLRESQIEEWSLRRYVALANDSLSDDEEVDDDEDNGDF